MRQNKINNLFTGCGFHDDVSAWFINKYRHPSPPQEKGWPVIASGKNTLILAPTGSGKTLTAFLWSIDQLYRMSKTIDADAFHKNATGIHTLYISPLKALNNDIYRNLKQPLAEIREQAAGSFIPSIKVAVRTGDTPAHVRQAMVKTPPHILITTPESLYLLLTSERGRPIFNHLKFIIVDEIHSLSGNKRGAHLSLSLERLNNLCKTEPLRIGLSATQKPVERIAAYLGGYQMNKAKVWRPRPVRIVDCGQKKDMDLQVITPVASFDDLPDASVWQPAYKMIYDLILEHKTTLVFVNMRSQAEKIARQLNELHRHLSGEERDIAFAHHGSISRESRYEIEEQLKNGQIPAVIATGSLELGIDIGSIGLVIQMEAPKSVSAGLQRVGRSGHLLGASSKGRIMIMYPGGADDALALADGMAKGEIETTDIPENALDVLAQQITAEVAMQKWNETNLYNLIRQSYGYHHLSPKIYDKVLDLLEGRYRGNSLRYLQARISRDRVDGSLTAHRGARMMAVLNGGSIPDRGYFSVRLTDGNVLLGEVEEEFVYETKVGDTFYLGNSEWRLREVRQDRIIVEPVAAISPKAPFWKGDVLYRAYDTSQKIGQFRRELSDKIKDKSADSWLMKNFSCDENTRKTILGFFEKQISQTGIMADDRVMLVEMTAGEGGEPVLFVHAPFGARVTGLYAILASARIEQMTNIQIQYAFDDDGFMMRLPELENVLDMGQALNISVNDGYQLLLKALPASPMFSVRFRYNAARSLILPRSRPGERIPLWLQRLRSADLLQAVENYSDFPVIMETTRDCLHEVFDWKALQLVLTNLQSGEIKIHTIQTNHPSAMAAGPLFKFVSVAMYEYDQKRLIDRGSNTARDILNELIDSPQTPRIKNLDLIEEHERRWQYLHSDYNSRDEEALYQMIHKLGPITEKDIALRCADEYQSWLRNLAAKKRIVKFGKLDGWIDAAELHLFENVQKAQNLRILIKRYLQGRGPVSLSEINEQFPVELNIINLALKKLAGENVLVCGNLMNGDGEYFCDRHNFSVLYRRQVSKQRSIYQPVNRNLYYQFILQWHGVGKDFYDIKEITDRYKGIAFPPFYFEREIIATRFPAHQTEAIEQFYQRINHGEIILLNGQINDSNRKKIRFINRGEGQWLARRQQDDSDKLSLAAKNLCQFLKENGVSYLRDAADALELSTLDITSAIKELFNHGFVSTDSETTFYKISDEGDVGSPSAESGNSIKKPRYHPGGRRQLYQMLKGNLSLLDSRWFLTAAFAVMGKPVQAEEQARRQALLLLNRYGVLVKEWYRHESGLLPWYQIFQQLKKMEWQGVIRRGYFIAGLSGLQFALPQAADLLLNISEKPDDRELPSVLISTIDPAIAFGGNIPWQLANLQGDELHVVRAAANHIYFWKGKPGAYLEQYASRIWFIENLNEDGMSKLADGIKQWLRLPAPLKSKRKIEIGLIDNQPAVSWGNKSILLSSGFEEDGKKIVLWPSSL